MMKGIMNTNTPTENTKSSVFTQKILIVGKNPSFLKMVKVFLCHHNFDVQIAFSFKRANALLSKDQFSAIIIEVHQSYMDVVRYVKNLRKSLKGDESPEVGIVVISDLEDRMLVKNGLQAGVDDFFTANQDLNLLYCRLNLLVERNFLKFQFNQLNLNKLKKRA